MPVSDKVRGFMEQGGWIRRMFEAGITLKAQHGVEGARLRHAAEAGAHVDAAAPEEFLVALEEN